MAVKVLFILKLREIYGTHVGLSSGLSNSARFVCDMLNEAGVPAAMEQAIDNNCIDRLVTLHRPEIVIIEAYWVVAEKFEILHKLHPRIKWIIRNHSEIPFLASEGVALDWTCKYMDYKNVYVSGNSPRIYSDMIEIVSSIKSEYKDRVVFLPNSYSFIERPILAKNDPGYINVGCFGAIRPLKNQLLQAISSLKFAHQIGRKLKFHINSERIEGGATANNALKNLKALFEHILVNGHELIEHPWLTHDEFLDLLSEKIDIALCVSHSETFCIVAADALGCNVPMVVSAEVPWATCLVKADPNNSDDIVAKMHRAWRSGPAGLCIRLSRNNLGRFCEHTCEQWLKVIDELT